MRERGPEKMTPRGYISWSQLDLWERNPERYKETYIYGGKNKTNSGQDFGKKMADGLEREEATGDEVLDAVMSMLPKHEIMDKEFDVEFGSREGVIKIKAKPDSMKADGTAFIEYKTGQEMWTKQKVDAFGQITFYAAAIWLKTGKIPREIELVHVKTQKTGKVAPEAEIEATGEIFRYQTKRSMAEVLDMMRRVTKAWREIEEMTGKEIL
jgi:hypothetical protein